MSQPADGFVQTVEQFCAWAEGDTHGLVEARQFLIALMADIPELEMLRRRASYLQVDAPEVDVPSRGLDAWKADQKRFADLPFQMYGVVFDPHAYFKVYDEQRGADADCGEPVLGDLCDDLADIYGDLWSGLQLHQAGHVDAAFSQWMETYFIHWGQHASSALRAIDIYYRQQVLER